jgi:hypothetical protein
MANTLAYYGTELIAGVKSFTSEGAKENTQNEEKRREEREEEKGRKRVRLGAGGRED